MKTKTTLPYTPGPWRYGQPKPTHPAIKAIACKGWYITPDGPGIDLAEVHLTASQNPKTQEANARLIASAPELHEALLKVRAFYGYGRKHLSQDESELMDVVDAALARAPRVEA